MCGRRRAPRLAVSRCGARAVDYRAVRLTRLGSMPTCRPMASGNGFRFQPLRRCASVAGTAPANSNPGGIEGCTNKERLRYCHAIERNPAVPRRYNYPKPWRCRRSSPLTYLRRAQGVSAKRCCPRLYRANTDGLIGSPTTSTRSSLSSTGDFIRSSAIH